MLIIYHPYITYPVCGGQRKSYIRVNSACAFKIEALSSARGAHAGHGTLRRVRESLDEVTET